MKKITRRNFLIASGKTVGTLAAASAFMGCASPEQAENCFPRSAMPVRTDDRLTAIDNIVENYMGQGYFPGATIVVARGGKIVYEKAYGYAMLNDMGVRLDDPRPMQMDTMFDMASCTKIMATTQSIMKLYSEGKIDLNATVANLLTSVNSLNKKINKKLLPDSVEHPATLISRQHSLSAENHRNGSSETINRHQEMAGNAEIQ